MSAPTSRERSAPERGRSRPSYAQASKQLLRNSLLDGLRELLLVKDWAQVTMSAVAGHAGVSRQTVYNEFGSRHGLAQAYALRLAGRFTSEIETAVEENVDDVDAALTAGFRGFFVAAAQDPMIRSLLSGEAKPDLLKLITTDSAPLIESASAHLEEILAESWIGLDRTTAGRLGRMITRMALSYISMPPEAESDAALDLSAVIAPAVVAARGAG